MEVIQRLSHRLLILGLTLTVDLFQPFLHSRSCIPEHMLQLGQLPKFRRPLFSVATLSKVANDPAQTIRFHHHQHRPAAGEQFIRTDLLHARPAGWIEHRQYGAGLERRRRL
jgi:hypothetical protein